MPSASASNLRSSRDVVTYGVLVSLGILSLVLVLALTDQRTLGLFRNTLLLAVGTCAIGLPVGTFLAYLIVRTDLPGRQFAGVLIASMLFIPLFFQTAGWDAGFGLGGFWLDPKTQLYKPLLHGWWGVIWIHGVAAIPWTTLIVGLGLRMTEPELEEEALLDASITTVVARVTFVRAIGSIAVAALWIVVASAGEITVTNIKGVNTYADEIYVLEGENVLQSTSGVLTALVASVWLTVAAMVITRKLAPPQISGPNRAPRQFHLRSWRWIAVASILFVLVALVLLPLSNLIYKAGFDVQQVGSEKVRGWSFAKTISIVLATPGDFRSEFGWTLLIGAASATAAIVLATPLAWLARRRRIGALLATVVTAVCLAVPGPLVSVFIIWLFNLDVVPWLATLYNRSILAPTLATMIRVLPLAIMILWYSMQLVAQDEVESAATEGAGAMSRLWWMGVKRRWLTIVVVWCIGLAIATGDVAASILVIPPGVETTARTVFGKLHSGVDDQAAGICLIYALGAAVLISAMLLCHKLSTRNWKSQ